MRTSSANGTCVSFEQFFDAYSRAYGARRDKKRAMGPWNRLSAKAREAAYNGIERYKEICVHAKTPMCYAQGYLSGERWNDEPLPESARVPAQGRIVPQQITMDFSRERDLQNAERDRRYEEMRRRAVSLEDARKSDEYWKALNEK